MKKVHIEKADDPQRERIMNSIVEGYIKTKCGKNHLLHAMLSVTRGFPNATTFGQMWKKI